MSTSGKVEWCTTVLVCSVDGVGEMRAQQLNTLRPGVRCGEMERTMAVCVD